MILHVFQIVEECDIESSGKGVRQNIQWDVASNFDTELGSNNSQENIVNTSIGYI